ncbi:MAG: membrane dipeptidase [Polyangia bacterium]
MKKRSTLFVVATLICAFVYALPSLADRHLNKVRRQKDRPSAEAKALHATLRIVDLHADSLMSPRNLEKRSSVGHVDLPRLREGNVTLQGFGLVTQVPRGMNMQSNDDRSDLMRWVAIAGRWPIATWTSPLARALYQSQKLAALDGVLVVRSRDDLAQLLERKKTNPALIGGLLGIEGAHALEQKLSNLEVLWSAGVRVVGLAHFFDNHWAGSAHGVHKGGLSADGRALLAAIEQKEMIVDLAHASPQTIDDVLALATRPPIVSHTGVAATCPGPRNLTDDQLRAIAGKGGLIGIGFWDIATCGKDPASIARAIVHAVAIAGVDHVALGSDFDGAVTTPFDAAGLVYVTDALLRAGVDAGTIRKVMGENAIALFSRILPAPGSAGK